MKCPKCQYLGFGSGSRCRNCGYDFSLSEEPAHLDLPIDAAAKPLGPLVDLPLAARQPDEAESSAREADIRPGSSPGESREQPHSNGSRPPAGSRTDLPLFMTDAVDDAPLVSVPAVPRPPLAVRRPAPLPAKPKADSADQDPSGERPASSTRRLSREDRQAAVGGTASEEESTAPALPRVLGGLIDVLILGAIDAAVVYLTLRVTGLQFAELAILPRIPLGAFLLLLNGGYLVLFTAAGGQTIGKMASGVRVVPRQPDAGPRVPFGTAVVRAAAYAVSLLPAGLGFLPILFSQDGRTLHDRLSDTRVVKA